MICPKCASRNVVENLLYSWSASCKDCGWSTNDYKPGPMTRETYERLKELEKGKVEG